MLRIAYERNGPTDAPVALLLHGFPDEVVLHSYCFRWGAAPPDSRYAALEKQLEPQPKISVPTIVLHGELDGASLVASSEGKEPYFSGPYERRVLAGVGHYMPREAPSAIVDAILSEWREERALMPERSE